MVLEEGRARIKGSAEPRRSPESSSGTFGLQPGSGFGSTFGHGRRRREAFVAHAETLYSNHFRGSPENRWQITDGTLTDLRFGRKVRCMFFTLAVRLEVPPVSVE